MSCGLFMLSKTRRCSACVASLLALFSSLRSCLRSTMLPLVVVMSCLFGVCKLLFACSLSKATALGGSAFSLLCPNYGILCNFAQANMHKKKDYGVETAMTRTQLILLLSWIGGCACVIHKQSGSLALAVLYYAPLLTLTLAIYRRHNDR